MKYKLLILPLAAVSATAGIAAAIFFSVIFFFLLFLLFVIVKTKQRTLSIVCLFSFCLYFILYTAADSANVSAYRTGNYTEHAAILDIPKIDGDRLSAVIRTRDKEKWAASYKIQSLEEKRKIAQLEPGMSCTFTGSLEEPKHATVPGGFDYKEYLYRQHIHWLFSVSSIQNCTKSEKPSFKLLHIRKYFISVIRGHVPESSAGIAEALTVGERFLVEDDVLSAYQKLGIVHLMAISGMHVGLIAAGLFYVLIRIGITREKAGVLLLLFLPVYTVLTGAAPSVLRASLMLGFYVAGNLFKRRIHSSAAISLSYLLLLLFNPYLLWDIGFQLSFAVSAALILSSAILKNARGKLVQLATASFVAELTSLPFLLYYFQQISLVSFPMNMIVVPFYTLFVIPCSVIGFLVLLVSRSAGEFVFYWFDLVMVWAHRLITSAASIDSFTIVVAKPSLLSLILLAISIFTIFAVIEKHGILRLRKSALFFCAVFVYIAIRPYLSPEGEADMLDIGQGDSLFMSAPHQRGTIMIDTGGMLSYSDEAWKEKRHPYSIGEKVLIPFLNGKGVKKLDALILTHADQDHIGEAGILIKKHRVKRLIVPVGFVKKPKDNDILQMAKEENISITEAERGDTITAGDLRFEVLSPEGPDARSKNDSSLVLWTFLGGVSWLLTGDLEMNGEQEVLDAFPSLKADILKAGHHGSKSSTGEAFLKQLKPKTALISAGKHNRYHHPNQEVLDRLKAYSVNVLRTDVSGTIQYRFKSGFGTFSVFPPYDIEEMRAPNEKRLPIDSSPESG
ncbi:DNA internalization-related competence protein ComEC/Rec2 [Bacillus sp. ISL-51]|uniref:DNA internalization-related competence protein ComEC/Rec2 n=1 Tax=unclassified Bacillus (in: firmicutes) TaxID=185979 RepID=UPI001BEB5E97|nr:MULTISPECIES: DNA internalization-related competence protein ComEC/Rec2 [unclassified Bacillus (in: firmicutes)]MBT2574355.1 DNA internalization-related competence protein ComEC/Rec2 [Bacillus sp. ISL-51]MBT2633172.1 DNA internalization-related competence protein ComEC/Rec2 [Bacillus sp. ISL-26]